MAYSKAEANLQRGELKQGIDELDNALRIVGNGAPDTVWRLRLLKAEILIWQGLNRNAVSLLQSGDVPDPGSPILLARRMVLLGVAQSNLQQLDLAEQTFHGVERSKAADSPEILGDLLQGEGKLAAMRRDTARSEFLFKRALQVSQSSGQTFLISKALGNLGVLAMQRSHYADAVDLFNQTLAAAEKVDAQTTIVRTTLNLGWAYRRMGDFDRASELFEQAEKRAKRLGMITDQTRAVRNLGMIEHIEHRFSAAADDYQQALQLARRAENQPDTIFCLTDLAQVAVEKNDLAMADKYNQEALQLEHSIGDHETELASLRNEADISLRKGDLKTAARLLRLVIVDRSTDVITRASAFSTQARMDEQQQQFASAKAHYKAAIAALEEERKSLGRDELALSYPTNAKDIYDDYIDFLVRHDDPDEAFRVSELQRARTLTDGLGLNEPGSQTFDVSEAQRAAARLGHPMLSYWIGAKSSYLWLLLPNHMQLFRLPGEETIRPLVERYRAHLLGPLGGDSLADADGQQLYRTLIGPAEEYLKPQSEVTIISDGPLCGLNFETLPVNSPKPHYWIEDVSITNASSAILLALGSRARGSHPTTVASNMLLIGNPQSPPNYPPLSHAGEEMSLVSQHFSKAKETILSGKEATPAAYFKAKPENYSLIHFVAHGTASRVSPLDSAVVLSQDGSSYNLYARDIAANRLHADLVTISACDSAGTRIYSSEGLVGLSWAFLRAGAQHVIASLWEVNDASTPKMMDHLYSSIVQGKDPAVALRDAKLTMVRSDSIYSRPFYWAPFVLYEGI